MFKLMKDLNLTSWIAENNPNQGWLPIGVESTPFKGKFYGNNHKISGLVITRSNQSYVGFFGFIDSAIIQDLTLEGTQVTGLNNVGTLVGQSTGSNISNITVKMTESVSGIQFVGGMGGQLTLTTLTDCHSEVTGGVRGTSYIGGLIGYTKQATNITDFSSKAIVSGEDLVGGIIGQAEDGVFQNGSETGNVSATNGSAGGFAGKATTYQLTDMTTNANISAQGSECRVGGMVAISNGTTNLTNCIYKGNVSGTQMVGGIVGELVGGSYQTFTSCLSKGNITNTGDYTGGIVAVSYGACIAGMESCSHFGDINGFSYIGGLIGAVLNIIKQPTLHTYESKDGSNNKHVNWYYETIVTGTGIDNKINNCTAIGNIIGHSNIGGLVGSETTANGYVSSANQIIDQYYKEYKYNFGQNTGHTLTGCPIYEGTTLVGYATFTYYTYTRNTISLSLTNNYYSGALHGSENVGGLVGYKSGGTVQNNYSYATIYGTTNVGGVVGYISDGIISNSYNTTALKSNVAICPTLSATSSGLGRIYGSVDNMDYTVIGALGSAEGNRALAQTKLVLQGVIQEFEDNLQQGTSIGPSALKLKANYVSWGWNFDENWNILETESFPYKKYQAAPPVIESELVSQKMGISGKSLNGGTVYLYYKDYDAVSTTCNGNNWTFSTEPLQSGAQVKVYADVEGMTPSYFATSFVGYPGSGTEEDPYRIYTAEDLQGASNRGYYKLMNDVDLTSWINENSPTEGWPAIGRNSGEVTYIDGNNHKVTGLWINTTKNFNGLFSNFSAGQIKNLAVEVAPGKMVKGGDFTGILIGRNANGKIVNCTVKGDVEGTNHTGGIAGLLVNSVITNILYDGNITSSSDSVFIGGLAGQTEGCNVSACNIKSAISLNGKDGKAGGLIGESKEGSIKSSKAQTTLTATGDNYYAGGLVGYSETPITLCSSEGTVTASGGTTYSGGLIGYTLSPVDNSYSAVKTTGTEFSAGLVGYTFSTIDKCYASGDIYGYMYGAGVVGELDGPNARLTNSVACNNILSLSAQSSWGCRVIGGYKNGASDPDESNLALSTMQVSLNGIPQNKTDDIVEGKATSPDMLKAKRTYEQLDWDFSKIWEIEEGTSYPVLQTDGSSVEPEPEPEPEPVATDDESITVAQISIAPGNTSNFAIHLTNKTTDLTAYQFDLILPIGFTLATNDKGKYLVTKTDRYNDDSQTLNITKVEGSANTYRFVCFSMSNETISGTSGAILNAVLAADKDIVDGTFEGKISDIVFTKADGKQLKLADAKFSIVINSIISGDANGDGEVNVSDIVEIVNNIMGKPSANFKQAAADLNGDGEINVTDIVKVVSIIMGNSNARKRASITKMADNDNLTIAVNNDKSYSLTLDNEALYVAAQFDIILSNGQTLESISLDGKRSDGHLMTYTKTDNNIYKVVVFSAENRPFKGIGGELLSFKVSGNGNVEISNILFVTNGETERMFPSLYAGTTGIDFVKTSESMDVYSIDGRMIRKQATNTNGMEKGLYIVNGKKVIVK